MTATIVDLDRVRKTRNRAAGVVTEQDVIERLAERNREAMAQLTEMPCDTELSFTTKGD
jgi:hypothetical protein